MKFDVETFVRNLVSRYVTHPNDIKVSRSNNRVYLSLSYLDHRLVIGKSGRNIQSLSLIVNLATAPHRFEISVPEGAVPADRLPSRPVVENEDPFSEQNAEEVLGVLRETLDACKVEVSHCKYTFPEPGTTAIEVKIDKPIDIDAKRAFSVIFGAMGKIHGRNIRIYIDDGNTD